MANLRNRDQPSERRNYTSFSDSTISYRWPVTKPESATFIAPNGHKKFLVASDHLESPRYRGYTPDDLFDLAVRRGLHFGQVRQTGVVFHMLSALGSAGRLGLTAVGNSPEEAQSIFGEAKRVLDEEARFNEL